MASAKTVLFSLCLVLSERSLLCREKEMVSSPAGMASSNLGFLAFGPVFEGGRLLNFNSTFMLVVDSTTAFFSSKLFEAILQPFRYMPLKSDWIVQIDYTHIHN